MDPVSSQSSDGCGSFKWTLDDEMELQQFERGYNEKQRLRDLDILTSDSIENEGEIKQLSVHEGGHHNLSLSGEKTLFQKFRAWKSWPGLSVTDLSSPAWCELQFVYSLYGKKDLPVERRPAAFTSPSGRIIEVDQVKTESQDIILKNGQKVHQILEKEAHPDIKVIITTITPEDRFALRLVTLVQKLDSLYRQNLAREVPIFGIVNGFLVTGIIDEIRRETPRASSREDNISHEHSTDVDSQWHVKNYLYDSKTRTQLFLPPLKSMEGSKYQLFLYKHLFDSLIREDFPWEKLFSRLQLNSRTPFSSSFRTDLLKLTQGADLEYSIGKAENLEQITQVLKHHLVEVGSSEPMLSIVYRWRGAAKRRKTMDIAELLTNVAKSNQKSGQSKNIPAAGTVIGQHTFFYDQSDLESWIDRMTELWTDQRDPRGVPAEDVYKCRSCEYQDTCEWLQHHRSHNAKLLDDRWITLATDNTPGEVAIDCLYPSSATSRSATM